MNQVVINLLNNAIKFTQKEGTIKFSISKNKDHVLLIVEDNGIGIEKDQQLHIFDRFYMADPSRSRALGGQGIGLAIVKSVVEAHKGSITVKSKLGLGTNQLISIDSVEKVHLDILSNSVVIFSKKDLSIATIKKEVFGLQIYEMT